MKKIKPSMSIRWARLKWFFTQLRILWWWKDKLGWDNEWPIIMFCQYRVGQRVRDDLTREEHTIIGVSYAEGKTNPDHKYNPNQMACWGVYIDSPYLDGARHPWEVSCLD
jgi:hypothetical protein